MNFNPLHKILNLFKIFVFSEEKKNWRESMTWLRSTLAALISVLVVLYVAYTSFTNKPKSTCKNVQDIEYCLITCEKDNQNLTCSMTITNKGYINVNPGFYSNEVSIMKPSGQQQFVNFITMDNNSGKNYVERPAPHEKKINASFEFRNIEQNLQKLTIFNAKNSFSFENVKVTNKK